MVKPTIEKDQLVKIRNQINQLLGETPKPPNLNQYEMMSESDLSEKEKLVIDCVRKNPGITKEGVVDALEGKYSRGPVFKAINSLEKYGMIVVRKNATNRQIHHLYINEESLLISTAERLGSIKNNFFDLINKVKTKQLQEWKDSQDYNYLTPILMMYSHLIITHILSSIFIWPKKTGDREIMQRLYAIGLARIQEIQIKLLEIISKDANILRHVLLNLFVLNPIKLEAVYSGLCDYKINGEVEFVLDSLWQFSFPLVRDHIGAWISGQTYMPEEREQILKDCEDWKKLVERVQRKWKEREDVQRGSRQSAGGMQYRHNVPRPRL
jgi:DNA-binding MarR family transcriptional regulator